MADTIRVAWSSKPAPACTRYRRSSVSTDSASFAAAWIVRRRAFSSRGAGPFGRFLPSSIRRGSSISMAMSRLAETAFFSSLATSSGLPVTMRFRAPGGGAEGRRTLNSRPVVPTLQVAASHKADKAVPQSSPCRRSGFNCSVPLPSRSVRRARYCSKGGGWPALVSAKMSGRLKRWRNLSLPASVSWLSAGGVLFAESRSSATVHCACASFFAASA